MNCFMPTKYLKGDKRFPNEVLGITYPLIKENMERRIIERHHLLDAVHSKTNEEMKKHLEKFISVREQRKTLIEEYLTYEINIETVEGPAFYVEFYTYLNTGKSSFTEELEQYHELLLDPYTATENIRKASYSSGLLLAICLD